MSIPREAVEAAARCIAGEIIFDEEERLDMAFAALTAALPHLLAAKDAEIAALKGALKPFLCECKKECPPDLDFLPIALVGPPAPRLR